MKNIKIEDLKNKLKKAYNREKDYEKKLEELDIVVENLITERNYNASN